MERGGGGGRCGEVVAGGLGKGADGTGAPGDGRTEQQCGEPQTVGRWQEGSGLQKEGAIGD